VDMLALIRGARVAAEKENDWVPKESKRDFALGRAQDLIAQNAPPQPTNLGTWHPAASEDDDEDEPGSLSPTAFSLRPRDTTFEKVDWNDPTLSEGFDGEERDRENYVGHALLRRWQDQRDPKDLERLFGHYDQAIGSTIRMYAKRPLPEPAIIGRVYNAFADAADKYDFSKTGAGGKSQQFHNYFTSWYAHRGDVKHWADEHSGFTRAPFDRAQKQDFVRNLVDEFHLDFDRAPTATEIVASADGRVKINDVQKILKELDSVGMGSKHLRSDFLISDDRIARHAIHRVRDRLKEKDRKAFDAWFAEPMGKPDPLKGLKKGEVAAKLGITPQKLSKQFSKFQELLQSEMDLIQMDM